MEVGWNIDGDTRIHEVISSITSSLDGDTRTTTKISAYLIKLEYLKSNYNEDQDSIQISSTKMCAKARLGIW